MRRTTISCDGCRASSQHVTGAVLDKTWLELHATHGDATYIDMAFCSTCKDNGRLVYQTLMRRIVETERKIQELRELSVAVAAES